MARGRRSNPSYCPLSWDNALLGHGVGHGSMGESIGGLYWRTMAGGEEDEEEADLCQVWQTTVFNVYQLKSANDTH